MNAAVSVIAFMCVCVCNKLFLNYKHDVWSFVRWEGMANELLAWELWPLSSHEDDKAGFLDLISIVFWQHTDHILPQEAFLHLIMSQSQANFKSTTHISLFFAWQPHTHLSIFCLFMATPLSWEKAMSCLIRNLQAESWHINFIGKIYYSKILFFIYVY